MSKKRDMQQLPPLELEIVTERDIDLLLMEELSGDNDFNRAFLSLVPGDHEGKWNFYGVWHSVSCQSLGESDLVAVWKHPDGCRHAVLIENKIAAPAQPSQAARYQRRGESGIKSGSWDSFITCIVAPAKYLEETEEAGQYTVKVSYEWLFDRIAESKLPPGRRRFRERMVRQAIEQNRRGYSPEHDERVTRFWRGYWHKVQGLFPELGLPEPKSRPSRSDWIYFKPELLPAGYALIHKLGSGKVDLQTTIAPEKISRFRADSKSVLHRDMSSAVTGKSCSVRIKVPPLDRLKEFDAQSEAALEGIKAAYRLACLAFVISSIDLE